MNNLSNESDIWVLKPTKEDLRAGAQYAAITLPWTFNRMYKNTSTRGQNERGLNIAKGIVVQEVLQRELERRGLYPTVERKSHRDSDLFDFQLPVGGNEVLMDIKSINYYSDYEVEGRQPFSPRLIIDNADYAGPDWRRFFPMLLPHTQIRQDKEAYCFCVASSPDFRKDIDSERVGYAITAYPYGEAMPFFGSPRLCHAREKEGRGVFINVRYIKPNSLFNGTPIVVNVVGEWDGDLRTESVTVAPGTTSSDIGPFSTILSFQIPRGDFNSFDGNISVEVSKNDLIKPIRNTSRKNVNIEPEKPLLFTKDDFCNLMLPSSYILYFLGWILKDEYLGLVEDYTGWVWPDDSDDRFKNQPWSQITEKDRKHLKRAGFDNAIKEDPKLLDAGWMKTHGSGGGACCYVFPNIGYRGGVSENNLYVLPKDLYTMNSMLKHND